VTQPTVDVLVDVYDSEILEIEAVILKLNAHAFHVLSIDAYVREAKERFGEIGFIVDVQIHEIQSSGLMPIGSYIPAITVKSRVEQPKTFDHERMAWEVQHNILGLDETAGAMQPDGSIKSPDQVTSLLIPKK
jgi:hypothetical protein